MFEVLSARIKFMLQSPMVVLALVLSCIGLLMMVSAGGGDMSVYATSQFVRIIAAFMFMLLIGLLPLRFLMQYAYVIYGLMLLVLIAVDIVGHIGMGAQRWLRLGGVNVQPSEFMKLALILALARYFHQLQPGQIRRVATLIPPILLMVIPAILILRQPNLGTTVVLVMVGCGMLFLAGLQWRYLIATAITALVSTPIIWHFLHDYQRQRVLTFLDPEQDPLGAGYNILQSMIAIGSGGFFGKGFMNGSQGQLDFLPEKHTDFIFTMLAEEFGFVGSVIVLGLYFFLMWVSLTVAVRSKSMFGAMVAAGVGLLLFVHVMINCAMVMGLVPVVGLPLPLLSYGGSITVSTLLALGLLLNAYVHRNKMPMREYPLF